jgi:hypothetical protein
MNTSFSMVSTALRGHWSIRGEIKVCINMSRGLVLGEEEVCIAWHGTVVHTHPRKVTLFSLLFSKAYSPMNESLTITSHHTTG